MKTIHGYLFALLKGLEARIPPPTLPGAVAAAHHGISVVRSGSDEVGWLDKLAIHVWVGGLNRTVFLDDDGSDFETPVDVLVDQIARAVQSA
jgi:hypothetical protein